MRMYDIIKKKRDGGELSEEEIKFFVEGYTKGKIPDYQAAALCMAIYYKGMTFEETAALTFAVRDSGAKLNFKGVNGVRVDKHSTGGVGDKTSLIVAPIVASCGVKVAKMSGRGLGHTGGTIDKLESIPGFKVELSRREFLKIAERVGVCIVGQNRSLAPADKKLYALRDVTATVDSLPLIVSSIMGKKLAADDDCIVLDVKTGSGAFCKTVEDSKRLAETMVRVGKAAGKKMLALITDMDIPLGHAIGNALEVKESIETLQGRGPKDLTEICNVLATEMLYLAGHGTREECAEKVKASICEGRALATLKEMIKAQGGDERCVTDFSLFPACPHRHAVKAKTSGYITHVDTEGYGIASLMLGAGRNRMDEKIDYGAGIILKKKTGDRVEAGDEIATMYASSVQLFSAAEARFLAATKIEDSAPTLRPLVLERVE